MDVLDIEEWLESGGRKRLTKKILAWGSLGVGVATLVLLLLGACGKGLPTLSTSSPSSSPSQEVMR